MKVRLIAWGLIAGTALAVLAAAGPNGVVSLSWTKALGTATFRIYVGTSTRYYTQLLEVGGATNATITGLAKNKTYYFAVTGTGTNKLESDFSNEIAAKAR